MRFLDPTDRSRSPQPGAASQAATGFLPDFCDNQTIFLIVLIVELLAFVLALAQGRTLERFWTELALTSLFMQWVALAVALVLCHCRRWLARLRPSAVTLVAFGVAQLITLACSLAALWLGADPSDPSASAMLPVIIGDQAISGIITLMALRYFYVQHQWKQQVQAEARARLRALQARIHPHFLFNTLNTIASLIRGQPDQAEQAVLALADLLRSALAQRETIALREELELTRHYLAIESLRLGARLRVDWRLDPDLPLDLPIPALVLQPLVENAIHHGIQRLPEGGALTVQIERRAHDLRITVVNPRQRVDGDPFRGPGQHLAQDNIRQRLQLAYATRDPLHIVETPDWYQVTFILPLSSGSLAG
ncbi:MAG: sensor histidine kinase [Candidatus Contendobacter sp.]|nr:sensor histidine kinase [Candidatus Contendobacter sp.]MDG4559631.1 sensor histidine kinase [Candidatus Contendobacter sp.]